MIVIKIEEIEMSSIVTPYVSRYWRLNPDHDSSGVVDNYRV